MTRTDLPSTLSPGEARRIDQTCDEFEAAWKSGRRPNPEEFLGGPDEPHRSALLRQLLLVDWDYRLHAGDDPRADFEVRCPNDAAIIEDASRAMAESAESTRLGADGPRNDHTPWTGNEAPPQADAAGAAPIGLSRYDLSQEVGHGG